MKIIYTNYFTNQRFNASPVTLSQLCNKPLIYETEKGRIFHWIKACYPPSYYSHKLNRDWYPISLQLRMNTRFSFIYDTIPFILQSLGVKPKELQKFVDPIVFMKALQDDILAEGILMITLDALLKWTLSALKSIVRTYVRKLLTGYKNLKEKEKEKLFLTLFEKYAQPLSPYIFIDYSQHDLSVSPKFSKLGSVAEVDEKEIINEIYNPD